MKNVLFNQYIYFKKEGTKNVKENFKLGTMNLYAYSVCIIHGLSSGYGYFG